MMLEWFEPNVTLEEERGLAGYMTRLAAASPGVTPRLADADVLLIKGRLLRRWQAERQVHAPLDAIEPFQIAAGLALAALLLLWSLPPLLRVLLGSWDLGLGT
jgi:hypothetical protein